VGALARVGLDPGALSGVDPSLLSTLIVNLLGAVLLGGATGHGLPRLSVTAREAITTGFLGSFTTFSALTTAWLSLTITGAPIVGLGYLAGSLLLGIVLAWFGILLGRRLRFAGGTRA